jgi:hypothetical protein
MAATVQRHWQVGVRGVKGRGRWQRWRRHRRVRRNRVCGGAAVTLEHGDSDNGCGQRGGQRQHPRAWQHRWQMRQGRHGSGQRLNSAFVHGQWTARGGQTKTGRVSSDSTAVRPNGQQELSPSTTNTSSRTQSTTVSTGCMASGSAGVRQNGQQGLSASTTTYRLGCVA